MKTYCLKCKTNTDNIDSKMVRMVNGTKKSRFVKK